MLMFATPGAHQLQEAVHSRQPTAGSDVYSTVVRASVRDFWVELPWHAQWL